MSLISLHKWNPSPQSTLNPSFNSIYSCFSAWLTPNVISLAIFQISSKCSFWYVCVLVRLFVCIQCQLCISEWLLVCFSEINYVCFDMFRHHNTMNCVFVCLSVICSVWFCVSVNHANHSYNTEHEHLWQGIHWIYSYFSFLSHSLFSVLGALQMSYAEPSCNFPVNYAGSWFLPGEVDVFASINMTHIYFK